LYNVSINLKALEETTERAVMERHRRRLETMR
jgi:formiminotetrahydrofolate cyclodeaminase